MITDDTKRTFGWLVGVAAASLTGLGAADILPATGPVHSVIGGTVIVLIILQTRLPQLWGTLRDPVPIPVEVKSAEPVPGTLAGPAIVLEKVTDTTPLELPAVKK